MEVLSVIFYCSGRCFSSDRQVSVRTCILSHRFVHMDWWWIHRERKYDYSIYLRPIGLSFLIHEMYISYRIFHILFRSNDTLIRRNVAKCYNISNIHGFLNFSQQKWCATLLTFYYLRIKYILKFFNNFYKFYIWIFSLSLVLLFDILIIICICISTGII